MAAISWDSGYQQSQHGTSFTPQAFIDDDPTHEGIGSGNLVILDIMDIATGQVSSRTSFDSQLHIFLI
jgi:hypothetical protein